MARFRYADFYRADSWPTMSQKITSSAKVFEDTIDGYFTLRESLGQMMQRNHFDTALVRILHAPAMEIPDLKPHDPVPLYITDAHSCMIHQMTLMVSTEDNKLTVSGAGQWTWADEHRLDDVQFSAEHRLAEPAFIRGIQLMNIQPPSDSDLCYTEPASSLEDKRQHVVLHTRLNDGLIVKGQCGAIERNVHIKPFESEQCVQQVSITNMVFENEQRQEQMLDEIFNEL